MMGMVATPEVLLYNNKQVNLAPEKGARRFTVKVFDVQYLFGKTFSGGGRNFSYPCCACFCRSRIAR
jgi:hypothetical protein